MLFAQSLKPDISISMSKQLNLNYLAAAGFFIT